MKLFKVLSIITFVFIISCGGENDESSNNDNKNYRELMRIFVKNISSYAKSKKTDFIVIAQNGIELITENGNSKTTVRYDYINVLDGISQEGLFYGYKDFNKKTPQSITDYLLGFLTIAKDEGKNVLITDYCSDTDKVDDSYIKNKNQGFISFQAESFDLDSIPSYPSNPWDENSDDINTLYQAKNYLYLLDYHSFPSKEELINQLKDTNYDVLIIDAFWDTNEPLTKQDINQLKQKANGGKRLVIAYMSIGEAEDYRYYWKKEWNTSLPDWIKDYQEWEGNYPVEFWTDDWEKIIYKGKNSYLDRILEVNFDGVFLDKIDIFEFFEEYGE